MNRPPARMIIQPIDKSRPRTWPRNAWERDRPYLPLAIPVRILNARTGRAFLKAWGSTDKKKNRHARLAQREG